SGLAGWTDLRATVADLRRWELGGNIGLIVRNVRPVDFDCEDVPLVAALRGVLDLRYGLYPWRGRSNSPRGMAIFRSDARLTGRLVRAGATGRVEILGLGNQLVGWGEHPSGVLYEWSGLCSPFEAPVEAFPHLPEDELGPLLDAFRAVLEAAGRVVQPV